MSDRSVTLTSYGTETPPSLSGSLGSIEDEDPESPVWAPSWQLGGRRSSDDNLLSIYAVPAQHTGYEVGTFDRESFEATFVSGDGYYDFGASIPSPEVKSSTPSPASGLSPIEEATEPESDGETSDGPSLPYETYQPLPDPPSLSGEWEDSDEETREVASLGGSSRETYGLAGGWTRPLGQQSPNYMFIDRDPYPSSDVEGGSVKSLPEVSYLSENWGDSSPVQQPVYMIYPSAPRGSGSNPHSLRSRPSLFGQDLFAPKPTYSADTSLIVDEDEDAESSSALSGATAALSGRSALSATTVDLISDNPDSYDPFREANYRPVREGLKNWRPQLSNESNKPYKPFVTLLRETTKAPSPIAASTTPQFTNVQTSIPSPIPRRRPSLPPFSELVEIPDGTENQGSHDAQSVAPWYQNSPRPSGPRPTSPSGSIESVILRPTVARSRFTKRFSNFVHGRGWTSNSSRSGPASEPDEQSTDLWVKTSRWVTGGARSVMSHYASRPDFSRFRYS